MAGIRHNLLACFLAVLWMATVLSGCGGGGGGIVPEDTVDPDAIASYQRSTSYSLASGNTGDITGYSISSRRADENLVAAVTYRGPGQDGSWYTGDDDVSFYIRGTYDAQGRREASTRYRGMGRDGRWFTDDDIIAGQDRVIEKNGSTWRYAWYADPGTDRTWGTGDDVATWYYELETDASARAVALTAYEEGDDGRLFTGDDELLSHEEYEYDADGRRIRLKRSSGKGVDGTWFTTDDIGFSSVESIYESGRLARENTYSSSISSTTSNPGPDDEWLTGDDVPEYYETSEYDAAGTDVTTYMHTPGADAEWGNADDAALPSGRIETFEQVAVPSGPVAVDSVPPTVSSSDPAAGALDVSVGTSSVTVDFTEDVIFYPSMLTVTGGVDTSRDYLTDEGSSITIYLADRPLSHGTTYTLTFTGLMDRSGNVMADISISFTTGPEDKTPPSISRSIPADGAGDVDADLLSIWVEFSEDVLLEASMIGISPAIPGFTSANYLFYPAAVYIDLAGLTLAPDQKYTVTFIGVQDLSGNVMPQAGVSFTTGDL